jgi:hypothetical protein
MFKRLTAHLDMVGESYSQHMLAAISIALKLQMAFWAQLLHAVFPFIDPPLRCDVRSLIDDLKLKLPENRSKGKRL